VAAARAVFISLNKSGEGVEGADGPGMGGLLGAAGADGVSAKEGAARASTWGVFLGQPVAINKETARSRIADGNE
jgi:hypothetical protein